MGKIEYGRLNIDVALKLIILLGFSLFFFISIINGTIQLFVHPRVVPFLKFGIVIMFIMSLFLLKDIFKRQRKKVNLYQYLFFIIPLIMAFILPANGVNSGSVAFGSDTDAVASSNSIVQGEIPNTDNYDNLSGADSLSGEDLSSDSTDENSFADDTYTKENSQNNDTSFMERTEEEDNSLKLQDDIVVMDDRNFVKWIDAIYNDPSKYEGKKINVMGFVFKDKQFKSNEFVPARMMMTCCAADMTTIGLLARYSKASELRENSWFKFTGTIENSEFNGKNIPVIIIETAERTAKPKNEYVYPY
jgi:putative membrane protein